MTLSSNPDVPASVPACRKRGRSKFLSATAHLEMFGVIGVSTEVDIRRMTLAVAFYRWIVDLDGSIIGACMHESSLN